MVPTSPSNQLQKKNASIFTRKNLKPSNKKQSSSKTPKHAQIQMNSLKGSYGSEVSKNIEVEAIDKHEARMPKNISHRQINENLLVLPLQI